ncbi:MAG: alkaline phosphatase family protein [Chromatocurvus sp.]
MPENSQNTVGLRRLQPARTRLSLLVLCASLISGWDTPPAEAAPEKKRAILISVDALNEEILRKTLTPEQAPALFELFDHGSCAQYAIPAFPSLTAPGHSSIWTGAYGDVTGISGNSQHPLPRDAYTIADTWSGYQSEPLSAESLWLAAGRSGVGVAAHQTTQSPGVPGYLPRTGTRSTEQEARRSEARATLADGNVSVVNGYNRLITGDALITAQQVTWTALSDWSGLDALQTQIAPKAFTFENKAGVFHGLVYGADNYDSVLISTTPEVSASISATAMPPGRAEDRASLAQHFSGALAVPVENGTVYMRVRLFDMAEDGTDFMLFHPRLQVIEGNTREIQAEYDHAVRGWIGNSAIGLYRQGAFGATLIDGGDGLAEERYLETAELMTRQFMRGADWFWNAHDVRFLLDYFPLSDAIDHTVLGYLDASTPMHDADLARRISAFRAEVWRYTDMRIRHLMDLADQKDAAFFITGDHGMRPSWQVFHPNVALRKAGLLTLDENGEPDLSRTRAYSPNGYWITINSDEWLQGTVTAEEKPSVVESVIHALTEFGESDGETPVTDTFTPETHPDLGLGGAAGGDVYWGLKRGFRNSARVDPKRIVEAGDLRTGHGFPSTDADMHTVFCARGAGFKEGRIQGVRTIDIAPTVADYLRIQTPQDAQGSSVLDSLRRTP